MSGHAEKMLPCKQCGTPVAVAPDALGVICSMCTLRNTDAFRRSHAKKHKEKTG